MRACWLKWVGRDWSISADYIWLNYSGANNGMHRHPLVEIAFVCAKGKSWVRRGDGALDELDDSPFSHYELGLPIDFDMVAPYQKM